MTRVEVDPARLPLMLAELRLPAIARLWPEFVERSDRESWPGARLLGSKWLHRVTMRLPCEIRRQPVAYKGLAIVNDVCSASSLTPKANIRFDYGFRTPLASQKFRKDESRGPVFGIGI